MDSTAFHELIARVRGASATLVEAERKVAAFKAELAQQENGTRLDTSPAPQKAIRAPIVRRSGSSGWVPEG